MNISILRSNGLQLLLSLLLALGLRGPLAAQELREVTLGEAVAAAAAHGPGIASAAARAEAARHAVGVARAGLLPQVAGEFGTLRSNDPVAVFGSRLRQERFTQADFDPALLNNPDALTDWTSALSLHWSALDLGTLASIDAAEAGREAAALAADWSSRSAAFLAEAHYIQALSADQLLDAARAAVDAAEANLSLISLRVEEGLLTEADHLRASAALEAALVRRIDAEREVSDARGRLGLALGWPPHVVPVPTNPAELPAPSTGQLPSLTNRPDIDASSQQVRAAEAQATGARRARLPRVGAFARYENHSADALSNLKDNWTVGVQVTIPLFTGLALTSGQHATTAAAAAARAEHEDRLRAANVQLREAQRALTTAAQQSNAAESARAAAEEAERLVRLRFQEGLATTADLLAAQSSAADLSANAVRARLGHQLAIARLRYLRNDTTTTNDSVEGIDS